MINTVVPTFVPLLLLLAMLVAMSPVTSAEDSIQVVSFSKARKTLNGLVMCALDTPNTTSSSSLQECSLSSVRDATCIGFNIRNSHTCDLYNYKPKIFVPLSTCMYYQVAPISDFLSSSRTVIRVRWLQIFQTWLQCVFP